MATDPSDTMYAKTWQGFATGPHTVAQNKTGTGYFCRSRVANPAPGQQE